MNPRARWLAVLAFLTVSSPALAVAAQPINGAEPPEAWRHLGPGGNHHARAPAVSTGWPDDGFLFVRLSHWPYAAFVNSLAAPPAARSFDGGRAWEPVMRAPPDGRLHALWTREFGRVLLLVQHWPPSGSDSDDRPRLFRSVDDGSTWSVARELPRLQVSRFSAAAPVAISPTVFEDAKLFVLDDGELLRSDDAGLTWHVQTPIAGQIVGTIQFSPTYVRDRRIIATVISAGFPRVGVQPEGEHLSAHLHSAGIAESTDGGWTWTPLGSPPAAGGEPFRHVRSVALSPTLADDGTMFADAWGSWHGPSPAQRRPLTATFRSSDFGTTWVPVIGPGSPEDLTRSSPLTSQNPTLVVLRGGRRAHVVRLVTYSSIVPSLHGCDLLESRDGGATWRQEEVVRRDYTCDNVIRFGGADPGIAFTYNRSNWRIVRASGARDGDQPRFGSFMLVPSTNVAAAPDGTLLVSGWGGVWANSPSARLVGGTLPCPHSAPAVYMRALDIAWHVASLLGCPVDEPRVVTLRERVLGDQHGLWLDDDSTHWLLAMPRGRIKEYSKADEPWSGPADRTIAVEAVSFHGGVALRIPKAGGPSSTLLVSSRAWAEVADQD
jgi:photosystem II stability/assembly factor-like uncharacterized protein